MRYTYTPDCRPLGPLAAFAVFGFPTMARTRRPVPARMLGRRTGWFTGQPRRAPRLLPTTTGGESASAVPSRTHGQAPGALPWVVYPDEEIYYWDGKDLVRAEAMARSVQPHGVTTSTIWDDFRAGMGVLVAERGDLGGPSQ